MYNYKVKIMNVFQKSINEVNLSSHEIQTNNLKLYPKNSARKYRKGVVEKETKVFLKGGERINKKKN